MPQKLKGGFTVRSTTTHHSEAIGDARWVWCELAHRHSSCMQHKDSAPLRASRACAVRQEAGVCSQHSGHATPCSAYRKRLCMRVCVCVVRNGGCIKCMLRAWTPQWSVLERWASRWWAACAKTSAPSLPFRRSLISPSPIPHPPFPHSPHYSRVLWRWWCVLTSDLQQNVAYFHGLGL